jgi:hypothetical protein
VQVHQFTRALKLGARQVWAVVEQVSNPLLFDMLRPSRAKDARHRQVHGKVPQLGRVQDIGIEKSRKRRHGSEAEFLIVRDQFGKCRTTIRLEFTLVLHRLCEGYAAMRSSCRRGSRGDEGNLTRVSTMDLDFERGKKKGRQRCLPFDSYSTGTTDSRPG